jgi:ribosomal protein S6--L-glutamate ligase
MRLAFLSRSRSLYTTRRLVQAARGEGHQAIVLDPLDLFMELGAGSPTLFHGGSARRLAPIDVAFPRIGAAVTEYGLAVIQQLEIMGVPVVNRTRAIALARDKMRCLQALSHAGIPVPRTAMIRHPRQVAQALAQVGGPPVVLKLIQGSQGIGVILLESVDAVESVLDTLWSLGQVILIQEFVSESRGRDLRALVLGGRVVAAMRREARAGEFRANIHRGGTGTIVDLPEVTREVASRAARIVGLEVAGVDMLEGADGPQVMEVNSSPGFQGLEAATGLDVAGEIVRHGLAVAAASDAA